MKQIISEKKGARYERKFIVEQLCLEELKQVIKQNTFLFSEIFFERKVNNIYLDSHTLESYHDNEQGVSNRIKYRIRWYGEFMGLIEKPTLELKLKHNALGKKLFFPLVPFVLDKNTDFKSLLTNVMLKSELPSWLIEDLRKLNISLFNRYSRKYYQSACKRFRITLDFDIEFFNTVSDLSICTPEKSEALVLELKYDSLFDNVANQVSSQFPFRLTKSSKYIAGLDAFQEFRFE